VKDYVKKEITFDQNIVQKWDEVFKDHEILKFTFPDPGQDFAAL
jgi:hypothetical protein